MLFCCLGKSFVARQSLSGIGNCSRTGFARSGCILGGVFRYLSRYLAIYMGGIWRMHLHRLVTEGLASLISNPRDLALRHIFYRSPSGVVLVLEYAL